MNKRNITKGILYPLGATVTKEGIHFCTPLRSSRESGVVLISKKDGQKERISFAEGTRAGNIASLYIEGISPNDYDYLFYDGEEEYVDPYAKHIIGNEVWGREGKKPNSLKGGLAVDAFDWGEDAPLCIPFEDSFLYCLHVRGFTIHKSSRVKGKGTFRGLKEKIPYLKDLGITAVELLPAYEFEEYEFPDEKVSGMNEKLGIKEEEKLNYWGFKKGYYFAPKASYSSIPNSALEFKQMVKAFHENGLEVIMQFYFPDDVKPGFICDVVRYWILEYHIDGIHLKGNHIPINLIGTEPLFANTKILYNYIPEDEVYYGQEKPAYRNLCIYSDDFMYNVRKFLKGDEDQLKDFIRIFTRREERVGNVNFVTNYYGFTLNDLVSYDQKHNEANGEGNRDGSNYNYSWNCGCEGKTRRPQILNLRKRMMKNAVMALLLSQGTPVLTAGDEFCNSQNGNNNPYCQDNDTGWLNWTANKYNQDMYEFTKMLIAFRKEQRYLHQAEPFTMVDRLRCGYPDLSYHGEEPYRADFANYKRHIGVMFSEAVEGKICLTYFAFNMYWEKKGFALPKLPKNMKWKVELSTGEVTELPPLEEKQQFLLQERSVAIFKSGIE